MRFIALILNEILNVCWGSFLVLSANSEFRNNNHAIFQFYRLIINWCKFYIYIFIYNSEHRRTGKKKSIEIFRRFLDRLASSARLKAQKRLEDYCCSGDLF